jgi:hypothetical protein
MPAYGKLMGMTERGIITRTWPTEVRQQAWQHYAGAGNGNLSEVARMLTNELGETVAVSTVHNWSVTDKWKERLTIEQVDSTRISMDGYVSRLWVAVSPSLSILSSIANGSLSADGPEAAANLDRQMRAAQFIVDKAQALLLKQASVSGKGKPAAAAADLSSLTSEQLQAMETQGTDVQ